VNVEEEKKPFIDWAGKLIDAVKDFLKNNGHI